MSKKVKNNINGVTLLALVITIIVLLILAAVGANLALGDGGILGEVRKAAKEWNEVTEGEQSDLSKLAKELRNARNGIYNGTTGSGNGNTTGGDETSGEGKIEELEKTIDELAGTIDDLNKQLEQEKTNKEELENRITDLTNKVDDLEKQVEEGKAQIEEKQAEIDNLNTEIASKNEELENKTTTIASLEETVNSLRDQITNLNLQIANLTAKQATGNAGVGDVLATKTFSNGSSVGLTGTMPNRGTLNWSGSNTTYSVPAGYYSGGTIDSRPSYTNGYNAGTSAGKKFSSIAQTYCPNAAGQAKGSENVAINSAGYYIAALMCYMERGTTYHTMTYSVKCNGGSVLASTEKTGTGGSNVRGFAFYMSYVYFSGAGSIDFTWNNTREENAYTYVSPLIYKLN